jgi:hypothetical protein
MQNSCYQLINVPFFIPLTTFFRLPLVFMSKTIIGILLSRHIVNAVESITLSLLLNTSAKDISSYFWAFGSFSGSAVKTPSTLVPFRSTSAEISIALSAAAVSVVK